MRALRVPTLLVLALLIVGASCAVTPVGKAIQAADAQKQIVERVTVEVIKLHMTGKVGDADYARVRAVYKEKYQPAQAAVAQSLATWKAVGSVDNELRLQIALRDLTPVVESYLKLARAFIPAETWAKIGGT